MSTIGFIVWKPIMYADTRTSHCARDGSSATILSVELLMSMPGLLLRNEESGVRRKMSP